MYQEIDETESGTDAGESGRAPWMWAAIAAAAVALVLVVILLMPSEPTRDVTPETRAEARLAYLAAIGEPSPALRRARLADFAQTYPDDARASAVAAQLSVLEAREASDWAEVTDVLFTPETSRLDRIAAIDAFEAKWGANLLGGRADEIAKLRTELEALPDPDTSSRALEEDSSPIPSSIQGSSMAGGPASDSQPIITLPQPEDPILLPPQDLVETPPELRRAPSPDYPNRARRRGIGAIVELEMDIDDRGRVDDVRILRVVADRYGKDFARAAERAAERSRFHPRQINGEDVATIGYKKRYRFEP